MRTFSINYTDAQNTLQRLALEVSDNEGRDAAIIVFHHLNPNCRIVSMTDPAGMTEYAQPPGGPDG